MKVIRSWREQKVMLKRLFSELSDSDFDGAEQEKETMLQHLAQKLAKSRKEVELIIADLKYF